MSIELHPFRVDDLRSIPVQARHRYLTLPILERAAIARRKLEGPHSWTAWHPAGFPLACCGILPDGGTWAFLAEDLRRHMTPVTRAVKRVLLGFPGTPYADIDENYPQAVKWAKLLGFYRHAPGKWVYARPT